MTHVFYGLEQASWLRSDAAPTESTTSYSFDPEFSRCSMHLGGIGNTTSYIETPTFTPLSTMWTHFRHLTDDVFNTLEFDFAYAMNAATGPVAKLTIQLQTTSGVIVRMYYFNAGWVQADTAIYLPTFTLHTLDWRVTGGASGVMALYVENSIRAAAIGLPMSTVTSLYKARFKNPYITTYLSEVMIADENLIGTNLFTRAPGGAGDSQDMTGGFGDVDETILNDADRLISASAGQLSLFTPVPIDLTDYDVLGIGVGARGKRGVTGPQSLDVAIRTQANTYLSADMGQDVGFQPNINIWETSPFTLAPWSSTDAAAVQFGAQSVA